MGERYRVAYTVDHVMAIFSDLIWSRQPHHSATDNLSEKIVICHADSLGRNLYVQSRHVLHIFHPQSTNKQTGQKIPKHALLCLCTLKLI